MERRALHIVLEDLRTHLRTQRNRVAGNLAAIDEAIRTLTAMYEVEAPAADPDAGTAGAPAKPEPHRRPAQKRPAAAPGENAPCTIADGIRGALAALKRPCTQMEIWEWCQRSGHRHITRMQVSQNLYALRTANQVRRTPGTEGMGESVTWELQQQQ